MKNNDDYLVSVLCMTYNQSAYISDSLNGFAMQQTNFPFVAVIVDDASTDGEQEVIKSYIEEHFDHSEGSGYKGWETGDACWIFARHKGNENCHFVAVLLKRNLYKEQEKKEAVIKDWMNAKYIALCEGDDYWTDPLKLQKQVDVMEGDESVSICVHRVNAVTKYNELMTWLFPPKDVEIIGRFGLEDYCREEYGNLQWVFQTSSFLFRKEMINKKENIPCMKLFPYGDMPLLLTCLLFGNGYFIPDVMSHYRYDSGGYNSSMKANLGAYVRSENELAKALLALDTYTQKKCHGFIMQRIAMCEFNSIKFGKGLKWRMLLPKYKKCLPGNTSRARFLSFVEIVSPETRKRLKRIRLKLKRWH